MKRGIWLAVFFILFLSGFSVAENVADSIPIQIQTLDASGVATTGTFTFKIDISNSATCSPVLYTNTTTLTTDSRGVVSYNLINVDLPFDEQYWFCYYRDGVLKSTIKSARTPYAFYAKNTSLSGVEVDKNLEMGSYNVTAGHFIGDGSQLTGVALSGSGDSLWTNVSNVATYSGNVNITGDLTLGGSVTGQNVSRVKAIGTSQSLPSGTYITLQFSNETFDLKNEWNGTRFTATEAGYYFIDMHILTSSAAWSGGNTISINLWKNGAVVDVPFYYTVPASATYFVGGSGTSLIYLDVGDYIELKVSQNSGATKTSYINDTGGIYTYLTISQLKQEINIGSSSSSGVPAGMIAPFNLSSCPVGWTLADGSSGTPDLRGIFIRGSGTNSILKYANGSYFSVANNVYKNDSFQGHGHEIRETTFGTYATWGTSGSNAGTGSNTGSGLITDRRWQAAFPIAVDTYGTPRASVETSPAYYSTIYCVKTTEDSATSNSIWTTSGNNVQLNNASKKFNFSQDVVSNFTLANNLPHLNFLIPFSEGSSTAGKIIFSNSGINYPMASIRSELYSQENDNGNLIFSAMWVNTLYDVMTISGNEVSIDGALTVTGQGSTINQSAWTAPTFQNSWVNYGSVFTVAGYMKDSMGFVHLRGLVKSGALGACIFTLPAGYRPEYQELQATISNSALGRVDITTAGCVLADSGNNAWFSLDGITFRAYA